MVLRGAKEKFKTAHSPMDPSLPFSPTAPIEPEGPAGPTSPFSPFILLSLPASAFVSW